MVNNTIKREVLKVLDLFRYQVENDECSYDELESLGILLSKELNAWVSAHDLSKIFNRNESSIRMTISRSHMPPKDKPKRRVLYRFAWFDKNRPSSWSE